MPNLAWFLFFAQLTLLSILALSILLWVVDLHEQRLRCALFHAHPGTVLVGLGALALGLARYFYIGERVILVQVSVLALCGLLYLLRRVKEGRHHDLRVRAALVMQSR